MHELELKFNQHTRMCIQFTSRRVNWLRQRRRHCRASKCAQQHCMCVCVFRPFRQQVILSTKKTINTKTIPIVRNWPSWWRCNEDVDTAKPPTRRSRVTASDITFVFNRQTNNNERSFTKQKNAKCAWIYLIQPACRGGARHHRIQLHCCRACWTTKRVRMKERERMSKITTAFVRRHRLCVKSIELTRASPSLQINIKIKIENMFRQTNET